MRLIVFIFLVSCFGAFAASPTDAALKVLTQLSKPDAPAGIPAGVMVSPFCGPGKLSAIEDAWKRRASWLAVEKVKLSSGVETIDGDLAAVLIQAIPENSPDAVTMIALGLKLEKGEWQVAPNEGSFQNVGLGFGKELRERVGRLEHWMASTRVNAVSDLKLAERKKFDESLKDSVDSKKLAVEDPELALQYFLESAEAGKLNEVLVWLGVLERDEFDDRQWDRELRVARLGLQGLDSRRSWRLLTSRKVMKVIMEGDGDEEEYSAMVSFLSSYEVEPDDNTRTPIRFRMLMTTNGWRVEMPGFFSHADESASAHRSAHRDNFSWEDRELSKRMGGVFEQKHEALRAESPEKLLDGIVSLMKEGAMVDYLRRIYREKEEPKKDEEEGGDDVDGEFVPDLEELEIPRGAQLRFRGGGNEEVSKIDERRFGRYQEAVNWWNKGMGRGEEVEAHKSELYLEEGMALGVLLVEPTGGDWTPEILKVWMGKDDDGWYVIPGVDRPLENSFDKSLAEVQDKLWEKVKGDIPKFEKEYFTRLWSKVATFDPKGNGVSEDEGRALVTKWRRVLATGTMMDLLDQSMISKVPEKPERLLNELKFVKAGAASSTVPDRILASKQEGKFTGFSMMVDEAGGHEMSCPLVIVAPSEKGPRVMADIELFLETNKAKRMRNFDNLDKIDANLDKGDAAAIQKLLEWHKKTAGPVWEEWNTQKAEK